MLTILFNAVITMQAPAPAPVRFTEAELVRVGFARAKK